MTFDDVLRKLAKKEHFSYSRWGDGEWACLLGHEGQNCDGHDYTPGLGDALRRVLEGQPEYILALQPHAVFRLGAEMDAYARKHKIDTTEWPNADIFHNASKDGRMDELFDVLNVLDNVTIVGPVWLGNYGIVGRLGDWSQHIVIPDKNCWSTSNQTRMILRTSTKRGGVLLFCASMMSNVLIDDLYREFGTRITMIDMGSVFDPYVGRCTRRYHEEILERMPV